MRIPLLISCSLALLTAPGAATAATLVSLDDIALDTVDRNAISQYGLSADFGGSYKVTVSGAPDNLDLFAPTLVPITAGDTVTLTLAHSAFPAGYNAFGFGPAGGVTFDEVIYNNNDNSYRATEPIDTPYQVTWTATDDYAAGTPLRWVSTVWPGTHDFYLIGATVVPEPSTGLLLTMGLLGLAFRQRHSA
jgi:hypothetical protein